MSKLDFVFIVHNHQPCDNFGWVFDDAYRKSYKPFIDILENYPKVKVAMHFSGSLFEWLEVNKPEYMEKLSGLVKRRQVDLLTGGFHEPILSIIPDRDKIGQIGMLTDYVKDKFGYASRGLWLAERVWENNLEDIFLKLGLEYTIVDENHLRMANVNEDYVNGYYELKNGFKVMAADKKLRYIIPFARLKEIRDYFSEILEKKGRAVVVFADDGEKFGFWPHTHDWVYKLNWFKNFLQFLSAEDSPVETIGINEVFQKYRPKGKINLKHSSYSEMMNWSKGDFRNFFKIYPEANIMRNRMLYISDKVSQAAARPIVTSSQKSILKSAASELYKAQAGCAYWHGVFGGLYLNHLRSGIYKHLIKAQGLLDKLRINQSLSVSMRDMDNDENEEVIIGNKFLDLYLKPNDGCSMFGLDSKTKGHNLINTIARRRETYHSRLFTRRRFWAALLKRSIKRTKFFDIQDILGMKGKGLRRYLVYDRHEKKSFMDYFISGGVNIRDFSRARHKNIVPINKAAGTSKKMLDKNTATFIVEKEETLSINRKEFPVYIRKEISISNEPEFYVRYKIRNRSKRRLKTIFATEFNWSIRHRDFLKNRDMRNIDSLSIDDEWTDVSVKHLFSDKVRLWTIPIYTLNESERGIEKNYQYLSILSQRPVILDSGESEEFSAKIEVG